jgi:tetratricopeptide (TPR) repeat protein
MRMTDKISMLYYNMGLEFLREDKVQDALSVLKKAVSLKDTSVEAWNLLGLCYYKLLKFEMARYCWNESLKVDSCDNKANEYIELFQPFYEKVKKDISEIDSLVLQKRYKEADNKFQNSVLKQKFSDCAEVANYEGILKKLSGGRDLAIALWKSVLKSEDKSSVYAVRYLADEMQRKGLLQRIFYKIFKR